MVIALDVCDRCAFMAANNQPPFRSDRDSAIRESLRSGAAIVERAERHVAAVTDQVRRVDDIVRRVRRYLFDSKLTAMRTAESLLRSSMAATDAIRVLLADDHETVRHGLKLLIDGEPDMHVVGEAGTGRAAVEQARQLHPTVVILDISMPELNGLEAARAISENAPGTAIVTLSRYSDEAYVQALLAAGARGYVLKQSASVELIAAIRAVADGRPYLDAALTDRVTGAFLARHTAAAQPKRITDREEEVLRLIAIGYSNKEIAQQLDLSGKTVEVHKANATRKLGLRGRVEIVRYAVREGWLHDA
jgi:two-component system, NarL family, response regulator NreC